MALHLPVTHDFELVVGLEGVVMLPEDQEAGDHLASQFAVVEGLIHF